MGEWIRGIRDCVKGVIEGVSIEGLRQCVDKVLGVRR